MELADRLLEGADAHAADAHAGGGDVAAAVQHYDQANRCLLASVGHAIEAASAYALTSGGAAGADGDTRDSSSSAATKVRDLTQQADTHLDYALFCDRLLRTLKLKRQQRQGMMAGDGDDDDADADGGGGGGAGADGGLAGIGGGEDALTESVVSHLFDAILAGTVFRGGG
jgi:hypothetical protein